MPGSRRMLEYSSNSSAPDRSKELRAPVFANVRVRTAYGELHTKSPNQVLTKWLRAWERTRRCRAVFAVRRRPGPAPQGLRRDGTGTAEFPPLARALNPSRRNSWHGRCSWDDGKSF